MYNYTKSWQYSLLNSLLPSDAIWQHRSGSILGQVMACSLTAPSHYLNWSWLIISKVLCHSSKGNSTENAHVSNRHNALTHWGRVTHICVSKLTIICSVNGLSPGRRQAVIWTNDGLLPIGPQGTNFKEILIEIHAFLFKKIHFKMSSGKMAAILSPFQIVKKLHIYNSNHIRHGRWVKQ